MVESCAGYMIVGVLGGCFAMCIAYLIVLSFRNISHNADMRKEKDDNPTIKEFKESMLKSLDKTRTVEELIGEMKRWYNFFIKYHMGKK